MSASFAPTTDLKIEEAVFYRDRLRAARYAALADSEGFDEICFAVEALGMRLCGHKSTLGKCYRSKISAVASLLSIKDELVKRHPGCFTAFETLYRTLNKARNDAMHTGAYARHATSSAIELCIHLEEAVMQAAISKPEKVMDYMVRQVISIEEWHPIAYARQLMLTHSFSFLPVKLENGWKLISEMSVASFLREHRAERLAMSIKEAMQQDSRFLEKAGEIRPDSEIADLYETHFENGARLWLVTEADGSDKLLGVLSPFELM